MTVTALPWYGGKVLLAPWIASLLPWEKKSVYVEPFGGMASVLLHRAPVRCEILNDQSGRVINWWRAVRDHPEEFGHLVEGTPWSRAEFKWAIKNLDNSNLSPIRRALAFHVFVQQSTIKGERTSPPWGLLISPEVGSRGRWRSERVTALAERLWQVQLEQSDALRLLERIAHEEKAVIYCDPPYYSTNLTPYAKIPDFARLRELLLKQKGRVALSGYPGEWESLGWHRSENRTPHRPIVRLKQGAQFESRPEVLWTNYDPASLRGPSLFG